MTVMTWDSLRHASNFSRYSGAFLLSVWWCDLVIMCVDRELNLIRCDWGEIAPACVHITFFIYFLPLTTAMCGIGNMDTEIGQNKSDLSSLKLLGLLDSRSQVLSGCI